VYFHVLFFVSISQVIGCEDCLRNDLNCVGWSVKLYFNQPTDVDSRVYMGYTETWKLRWLASTCKPLFGLLWLLFIVV